MGRGLVKRIASCLLAALLLWATGLSDVLAEDKPKPGLTVVMEGDSLLANQSVDVHVWVENPFDAPMSHLRLALNGPSTFLFLGHPDESGACKEVVGDIGLEPDLAPHNAFASPSRLCVGARRKVIEQDVNIAFSLSYRLADPAGPRTGVVVVEKKLSIGLLGTGTVAGVSMRLTSLFLPGALFLMVLTLAKFPWVDRLSGTDNAIVAVILSISLSFLGAWLAVWGKLPWMETGAGVSAAMLLTVCALAVALAIILTAIHGAWARAQRKAQAALLVADGDSDKAILLKALKAAGGDVSPVSVATPTVRYVGSAAARTPSGGMVVLGWYEAKSSNPATQAKLAALIGAKRYVDALALPGVEVAPSNLVRTFETKADVMTGVAADVVRLTAKEKPELTRGPVPELDVTDPPLTLGQP